MKKNLFRLAGILVLAVMLVSSFATLGLASDADDKEQYADTSVDDARFVTQYISDATGFNLREPAEATGITKTNSEKGGWVKYENTNANYRKQLTSDFHFGDEELIGTGGRNIKTPFLFACDVKLPVDYSGEIGFVVRKHIGTGIVNIPVYLGFNGGEFFVDPCSGDKGFNGNYAKKLVEVENTAAGKNGSLSDRWYGYASNDRRKFARVYIYLNPYTGEGAAFVRGYLIAQDGSLDSFKDGLSDTLSDGSYTIRRINFKIDPDTMLTKEKAVTDANTEANSYSIALYNTNNAVTSVEIRNAKIYVPETTIFDKPTVSLNEGKVRASATFYDFSYSGTTHNVYPLITAVYNHDTKEVVTVEKKDQDIQRGSGFYNFGKKVAEKDVDLSALSDGVYDVKAFVWKSLSDIMPKTSSAVKTFKVETTESGKTVTEIENN